MMWMEDGWVGRLEGCGGGTLLRSSSFEGQEVERCRVVEGGTLLRSALVGHSLGDDGSFEGREAGSYYSREGACASTLGRMAKEEHSHLPIF